MKRSTYLTATELVKRAENGPVDQVPRERHYRRAAGRAATASRMVLARESRISANDPRDTEEAHFRCCIRCIRERLVAREARKELVLA